MTRPDQNYFKKILVVQFLPHPVFIDFIQTFCLTVRIL